MNYQISSSSTTTTRPNGEDDLPEDLILEIFSHLPPISLLRFKSISKTFHSLISNPDFLRRNTVRRRLDPSPPPCILLNRQDSPEHPIIPLFRSSRIDPFTSILLKRRRQDFPEHSIIPIFRRLPGGLFYGFMPHGDDGDEESDDDDDDHQHYYGYSAQLLQNLNDYQPEHDQQPEGNEKVEFRLIDSCNGLLLYLNYAITYIIHRGFCRGKCILYVCNPITKDCIKLPTFEEEEEEQQAEFKILDYSSANIVFDPSISLTYKVVIWLACRYNYLPEKKKKKEEEEEEEHYRLYVYSSETRSWRLSYLGTSWKLSVSTIDYILLNQFNYEFRAVLLKGVLYWSKIMGWQWLNVSLCYDVEKDLVWTLKLPKMPVEYERHVLYFGVCGGSLRLIEKYYNRNGKPDNFPSSLDVMELNHLQLQQQQQWTVKYRVNIGEEGYYANYIRKCSLSDVSILDLYKTTMKEGEGEEMLLCINDHSLVISFNLSNNTFGKELRNNETRESRDSFWFTNVLRYTITLFPLH